MSTTGGRILGKVFVAGGSGYVGREVVRKLLEAGFEAISLVRSLPHEAAGAPEGLHLIKGDALDADSLRGAMGGCSAVANCIGIIREKRWRGITYERLHLDVVRNLLDEADRAGIGRFVQVSAIGARPDGVSRYQTTKFRAEEEIARRSPDWTVLRPSIIVGPGRGIISTLKPLVRLPLTPVFGDGRYAFEPVDKRVVAEAVVRVLGNPEALGRVFELRGPRVYTYNELLDALGRALGRKIVRKLHLPLWPAKLLVRLFGWLPFSPVNRDQLAMLLESRASDVENGVDILGLGRIDLPAQLEYALKHN